MKNEELKMKNVETGFAGGNLNSFAAGKLDVYHSSFTILHSKTGGF